MQQLLRRELGGVVAHISHSTRADGDLSPSTVDAADLAERRTEAVPHAWRALHQVHSDRVVVVDSAVGSDQFGPAQPRPKADALVTHQTGVALAVHSGDCVPVGFVSDAGAIAAAHAGWKGLEAGVLESTVRELHAITGGGAITAVVGPHIRTDRYEFGAADLARLARRFGPGVIGTTSLGQPALDLTSAIGAELDRLNVPVAVWSPDCTARDHDKYWSHRARSEPGRIALVAWLEER